MILENNLSILDINLISTLHVCSRTKSIFLSMIFILIVEWLRIHKLTNELAGLPEDYAGTHANVHALLDSKLRDLYD